MVIQKCIVSLGVKIPRMSYFGSFDDDLIKFRSHVSKQKTKMMDQYV